MPTISLRPVPDPRLARNFTLNQFNLLYDDTGEAVDLCQVHFYDYNPAFLASATRSDPASERRACPRGAAAADLGRTGLRAGLGVAEGEGRGASAPGRKDRLPDLEIDREPGDGWPPMLQRSGAFDAEGRSRPGPVAGGPDDLRLRRGEELPLRRELPPWSGATATTTDRTGRLAAWDHIHLVDASVFPDVPATTFTLTIMANAHRIASETLGASLDDRGPCSASPHSEPAARCRHHGRQRLPGLGPRRRLRIGRVLGPSPGSVPGPGERRPFLRPGARSVRPMPSWRRPARPLRLRHDADHAGPTSGSRTSSARSRSSTRPLSSRGSTDHRAVVDVGVSGDTSALRSGQAGGGGGSPGPGVVRRPPGLGLRAGAGWDGRDPAPAGRPSRCFPTSGREHTNSPFHRMIWRPPCSPWPRD